MSTSFKLRIMTSLSFNTQGIKKETSLSAGTNKNLSLVRTLEWLAVPIFLRQDKETLLLKIMQKHNVYAEDKLFITQRRKECSAKFLN